MYSYKRCHKAPPCGRSCRQLGKSSSCKHGTVPQGNPDNERNLVIQCSFPILLMFTHSAVPVSVHLTLAISGEVSQVGTHGRKNLRRAINSIFLRISTQHRACFLVRKDNRPDALPLYSPHLVGWLSQDLGPVWPGMKTLEKKKSQQNRKELRWGCIIFRVL